MGKIPQSQAAFSPPFFLFEKSWSPPKAPLPLRERTGERKRGGQAGLRNVVCALRILNDGHEPCTRGSQDEDDAQTFHGQAAGRGWSEPRRLGGQARQDVRSHVKREPPSGVPRPALHAACQFFDRPNWTLACVLVSYGGSVVRPVLPAGLALRPAFRTQVAALPAGRVSHVWGFATFFPDNTLHALTGIRRPRF